MTVTEQKIIPLDMDNRLYIPLRKTFHNKIVPSHTKKAKLSKEQAKTMSISNDTRLYLKRIRDELQLQSYGHVIEYLKLQVEMKQDLLDYAEELQDTLRQYTGLIMKVSNMQAGLVEDRLVNKYNLIQNSVIDQVNSLNFQQILNYSLRSVPSQTRQTFLRNLSTITWKDGQETLSLLAILENLFNNTIYYSRAIITEAFEKNST